MARTPWRFASAAIPAIASAVRFSGSSPILPVSASPSPSRVSSARSEMVVQPPSAGTACDVELHRIGPDVDDCVALRLVVEERGQPAEVIGVRVSAQTQGFDRTDDRIRIFGFDRDGADRLAVRDDVRELGHAALDGVPDAPLVNANDPDAAVRTVEGVQQGFQRAAFTQGSRNRDAQGIKHRRDIACRQAETRPS